MVSREYSEKRREAARAAENLIKGKTFEEKMAIYGRKKAELERVIANEDLRIKLILGKEAEANGFGNEDGFKPDTKNPLRDIQYAERLMTINFCKERQARALLETAYIAGNIATWHIEMLGRKGVSELMSARTRGIDKAMSLSDDIGIREATVRRYLADAKKTARAISGKRKERKPVLSVPKAMKSARRRR